MASNSDKLDLSPDAFDLPSSSDPQARIDDLNTLAWDLRNVDAARSLAYSQQAYTLSHAEPFTAKPYAKGIVRSLLAMGVSDHLTGNYGQALSQLLEAKTRAEAIGDLRSQAEAMLNVAQTYFLLGSLPIALDHALKAVEKCRAAGYAEGEAGAYNAMGIIEDKLGNHQKALDALRMSLQIHRDLGNREGEAELLNNIASVSYSDHDYDNALASAYQGLQIAQEMQISLLETAVLCTVGEIQHAKGNIEEALKYFQKSVEQARRLGFTYLEMYVLLSLGQLYTQTGDLNEAFPRLQQALEIARRIDTKAEVYRCYQLLSEVCKRKGDFESALYHLEQYHRVYLEVFNEASDRRAKNLQIVHETETAQKEAEIYRLRNVELERLVEELDAFSHTVAHDLKNPLSMIVGFSELLLREPGEFTEEEIRTMLKGVASGAVKMNEIVDALLMLARLRSMNEVRLSEVYMGPVLRNVQQRLIHEIAKRQAEIRVPASWPVARGYVPWIEEVWANYLSNALKYGGTPPIITFGATEESDGMIRYWIHDNGVGLTPEERKLLFTPFTRLRRVGIEGHGLGLSIVRRIVDRLGGKVGVESSPGAGSTFSFTLPSAQADKS